jgi:signal transduction histidine kinase
MLADDVEWDRASQHEFLTIISDESDRLTNLVNNLLDLSRIEAGSLRLSREKCDIKEMVNEAAKQARLTPGNRFDVHVEAKLPKLYADPPRLESILRNLIENAVKYGGENATVRVEACVQGNDFLFRVIDNGPGIPEKERPHIFESFYRVDDSLARLTSGAGLGLAICQGLVAHGGRIWSNPRRWEPASNIPAKPVHQTILKAKRWTMNINVLVVDEKNSARLCACNLKCAYKVLTTSNGLEHWRFPKMKIFSL